MFLDENITRDPEGLASMASVLNCKQVRKDVRKNYYAAEHFLDKVLDTFLVIAGKERLNAGTDNETGSIAIHDNLSIYF